jgi:hypothetical protein
VGCQHLTCKTFSSKHDSRNPSQAAHAMHHGALLRGARGATAACHFTGSRVPPLRGASCLRVATSTTSFSSLFRPSPLCTDNASAAGGNEGSAPWVRVPLPPISSRPHAAAWGRRDGHGARGFATDTKAVDNSKKEQALAAAPSVVVGPAHAHRGSTAAPKDPTLGFTVHGMLPTAVPSNPEEYSQHFNSAGDVRLYPEPYTLNPDSLNPKNPERSL